MSANTSSPFVPATRREFLRRSGGGIGLLAFSRFAPAFLVNSTAALAAPAPERDRSILVLVQLAGGNDGLNTLVPFEDPNYYRLRPTLGIAKGQVLPISDTLGFHPSCASLRGLATARGSSVRRPERQLPSQSQPQPLSLDRDLGNGQRRQRISRHRLDPGRYSGQCLLRHPGGRPRPGGGPCQHAKRRAGIIRRRAGTTRRLGLSPYGGGRREKLEETPEDPGNESQANRGRDAARKVSSNIPTWTPW